jgi:hypothetical protein
VLPLVLGDQRFGLGGEPVLVHASTRSPDTRFQAGRLTVQCGIALCD